MTVMEVIVTIMGGAAISVLLTISHRLGGIEVQLTTLNSRVSRLEKLTGGESID